LRSLEGTSLAALNMSSTTAEREDLDQALFGTSVTRLDQPGNEVGSYFQRDGLFTGGEGEPTNSAVLAFPKVGFLGCDEPVLWVHPRFEGQFPRALNDLESRCAPGAGPDGTVRPAGQTDVLRNLGFVKKR